MMRNALSGRASGCPHRSANHRLQRGGLVVEPGANDFERLIEGEAGQRRLGYRDTGHFSRRLDGKRSEVLRNRPVDRTIVEGVLRGGMVSVDCNHLRR